MRVWEYGSGILFFNSHTLILSYSHTPILSYSHTPILVISVADNQTAVMSKCSQTRPSIPLFLNHMAYNDIRCLKYKPVFYSQRQTAKPGIFHVYDLY